MRKLLREHGASGYRLHRRDLPGRPDIAFMRWRVAVFVDGAFWHGHPDLWHEGRVTNVYWRTKIARNISRDRAADRALREAGWVVVRVWDVDLQKDPDLSVSRVLRSLAARGWNPAARRLPSDGEVEG